MFQRLISKLLRRLVLDLNMIPKPRLVKTSINEDINFCDNYGWLGQLTYSCDRYVTEIVNYETTLSQPLGDQTSMHNVVTFTSCGHFGWKSVKVSLNTFQNKISFCLFSIGVY